MRYAAGETFHLATLATGLLGARYIINNGVADEHGLAAIGLGTLTAILFGIGGDLKKPPASA